MERKRGFLWLRYLDPFYYLLLFYCKLFKVDKETQSFLTESVYGFSLSLEKAKKKIKHLIILSVISIFFTITLIVLVVFLIVSKLS